MHKIYKAQEFGCWLRTLDCGERLSQFAIYQELIRIKIKFNLSNSQEPSMCLLSSGFILKGILGLLDLTKYIYLVIGFNGSMFYKTYTIHSIHIHHT